MYEYKTLEQVSPVIIYQTYREAFEGIPSIGGDSFKAFAEMLQNCGYLSEGSMGAFEKSSGKLVAFALNSIYIYGGSSAAYNILTGTLPAYRNKGLAHELLERIELLLCEHQVTVYTTEATQNNSPAVALFRSLGFEVIGKLSTLVTDENGSRDISQYTFQLNL